MLKGESFDYRDFVFDKRVAESFLSNNRIYAILLIILNHENFFAFSYSNLDHAT